MSWWVRGKIKTAREARASLTGSENTLLGLETREEIQLGDVVHHDEGEEQNQHHESDLINALLEFLLEIAPQQAFDAEQQDHASVEDGDRQQVHDAQVEADEGSQADDRLPAVHLRRFAGHARHADRTTELLHDRTMTRKHAVQDVENQPGIVQVVGHGAAHRLGQRQLLNVEGRQRRSEAEAVAWLAGAVVGPNRLDGYVEPLAVSLDHQICRFVAGLIENRDHGVYSVNHLA